MGITPAVLEFMGIHHPEIRKSENWLPLIRKPKTKWDRPILSFAFKPSSLTDKISVIHWPYQVILDQPPDRQPNSEFYNLNISFSFSRYDRISRNVMVTSSNRQHRFLMSEVKKRKSIFFKKNHLIMVDATGIERLRMLGYIN
jgi:hypothetical protein